MKKKRPLKDYDELTCAEKELIIKEFKNNYTGEGIINRWNITREAFRKLRDESRFTAY
ncbi:TPA: hypothetical protein ACJFV9_004406 [Salmonella enterica subsp. enterica serovar Infantis]